MAPPRCHRLARKLPIVPLTLTDALASERSAVVHVFERLRHGCHDFLACFLFFLNPGNRLPFRRLQDGQLTRRFSNVVFPPQAIGVT